jgi:hypothetical protein
MPSPSRSWPDGLTLLMAWAEQVGHARVPQKFITPDGFRLGKWVHNARTAYRARTSPVRGVRALSDERVALLEAVPGWEWNTRARRGGEETLAAEDFDARVATPVAVRALCQWLADRPRGEPFTEEMLGADARYQWLWQQETIRASLAALVASGYVRAATAAGAPLTWQEVVRAPVLDPSWTFGSAPGERASGRVPVEVATFYDEVADTESTPISA